MNITPKDSEKFQSGMSSREPLKPKFNTDDDQHFKLHFTASKVKVSLLKIISVLLLASILGIFLKEYLGISVVNRLFNLDKEANIPTFFSSLLLLFSSLILFFLYRRAASKNRYWLFLSGLFLFLAIDETAQIHEIFNNRQSQVAILTQIEMRNLWVFPYLLLVVFVIIFLKNFIFGLPKKTRNLFIFSGIIFVGAAAGLEILQEQLKIANGGVDTSVLKVLYNLEEVCEMVGITIFIYALLDFIAPQNAPIEIKS